MSLLADVTRSFAEFLIEKCRRELIGQALTTEDSDKNAPRILDKISSETLAQVFGYRDCPEWRRYVIDLDGTVPPDVFSHENALYLHAPRIFKAGTVFGIEKLQRTRTFSEEYRSAVQQAVTAAASQGIVIAFPKSNPTDGIYILEEHNNQKVKFAYFRLRVDGGSDG